MHTHIWKQKKSCEFDSTGKKNEIMTFSERLIELDIIMLFKVSQTQNHKYASPQMWNTYIS